MPNNVGMLFNRWYRADFVAADPGNPFVGVQLMDQSQVVVINGISWGFAIESNADRNAILNAYCAIVTNYRVNANDPNLFSRLYPNLDQEVVWFDVMQSGLDGGRYRDFATPIVLPAGQPHLIYVPVPLMTPPNVNTLSAMLCVRGHYGESDQQTRGPRPRGF